MDESVIKCDRCDEPSVVVLGGDCHACNEHAPKCRACGRDALSHASPSFRCSGYDVTIGDLVAAGWGA